MIRFIYYLIPSVALLHMLSLNLLQFDICRPLVDVFTPLVAVLCLHILYLGVFGCWQAVEFEAIESEKEPKLFRCRHCARFGNEQTKHCGICNRCIDDFDHHCDILEICIGRENIAWFRAFLVGCSSVCAYGATEHFRLIKCTLKHQEFHANVLYIALFVLELTFAIALSLFALFHCILWACGTSTYRLILTCRRFIKERWKTV